MEKLSAETLRWALFPRDLNCDSSRDLKPLDNIVGQDRAIRSLKLGLEIKDQGFNVYVAGPPGTGKTTSVKRFLEEVSKQKKRPGDWCYVNNFREPYRPKTLAFAPGKAKEFQNDIQNLVGSIRREIRKSFESEEYEARKEGETKTIQQQKEELFRRLNEEAQKEGFVIQMTPMGVVTIPLREGNPMSNEELLSLRPEEKEEINRKGEKLQDRPGTRQKELLGPRKKNAWALWPDPAGKRRRQG